MAIEVKLFEDIPGGYDTWRKEYHRQKQEHFDRVDKMAKDINASVDTVVKKRDKGQEIKDFFEAQLQLSKDVLPKQTQGSLYQLFDMQYHNAKEFQNLQGEMTATPSQAFDIVYPAPQGNTNLPKPAMEPTSKINGTLLLDVKQNSAKWIGDQYLPKRIQSDKGDFVPPVSQLSSAKEGAKYGYIMAILPEPFATNLREFAKSIIDPDSLALDGFEQEPHCTVLYGFAESFAPEQLEAEFSKRKPLTFAFDKVQRFEATDHDVMVFNLNAPSLHEVNSSLKQKFGDHITETHPIYHPHVTLAYVKKGTNKDLDGKPAGSLAFKIGTVVYSHPNGSRKNLSLAWDGKIFNDGGQQDSFSSSVGDVIERALKSANFDKPGATHYNGGVVNSLQLEEKSGS